MENGYLFINDIDENLISEFNEVSSVLPWMISPLVKAMGEVGGNTFALGKGVEGVHSMIKIGGEWLKNKSKTNSVPDVPVIQENLWQHAKRSTGEAWKKHKGKMLIAGAVPLVGAGVAAGLQYDDYMNRRKRNRNPIRRVSRRLFGRRKRRQ